LSGGLIPTYEVASFRSEIFHSPGKVEGTVNDVLCRAECAFFAHSAEKVNVGVSLQNTPKFSLSSGGLISTYQVASFPSQIVHSPGKVEGTVKDVFRRAECASFAHSADNVNVGVRPQNVLGF